MSVVLHCICLRMSWSLVLVLLSVYFFFQAEDGIRDLVRSRGLGDVYKRQGQEGARKESSFQHLLVSMPGRAGKSRRALRAGECLSLIHI